MKTGDCVSAEALVRWLHPVLGRVVPDEFILYAEKSGFIIDIDMLPKVAREWCRKKEELWNKACDIDTEEAWEEFEAV